MSVKESQNGRIEVQQQAVAGDLLGLRQPNRHHDLIGVVDRSGDDLQARVLVQIGSYSGFGEHALCRLTEQRGESHEIWETDVAVPI